MELDLKILLRLQAAVFIDDARFCFFPLDEKLLEGEARLGDRVRLELDFDYLLVELSSLNLDSDQMLLLRSDLLYPEECVKVAALHLMHDPVHVLFEKLWSELSIDGPNLVVHLQDNSALVEELGFHNLPQVEGDIGLSLVLHAHLLDVLVPLDEEVAQAVACIVLEEGLRFDKLVHVEVMVDLD